MANKQLVSGLFKSPELKNRLVFLLTALVVFRIGAHIPVPGVDAIALVEAYRGNSNGILSMLNIFSGGSLERFSIFAIGIMPYISASIVVQLASEIIPSLKSLKKEGDIGRRLITKYTRLGTIILATLQGFVAATFVYQQHVVVTNRLEFYFIAVICLVTGTMFLMWLGEQITERGPDLLQNRAGPQLQEPGPRHLGRGASPEPFQVGGGAIVGATGWFTYHNHPVDGFYRGQQRWISRHGHGSRNRVRLQGQVHYASQIPGLQRLRNHIPVLPAAHGGLHRVGLLHRPSPCRVGAVGVPRGDPRQTHGTHESRDQDSPAPRSGSCFLLGGLGLVVSGDLDR